MENLIEIIKKLYPDLSKKIQIWNEPSGLTGELKLKNPRYSLWFTEEGDGLYIVGINFIHNHFASSEKDLNLEEALKYFDDIINDRIVAIGFRGKNEDFLIAILPTGIELKQYQNQLSIFEIVSFTKEYYAIDLFFSLKIGNEVLPITIEGKD